MFLHLVNRAYTNCTPNSNEQDSMSLLTVWAKRKDSIHNICKSNFKPKPRTYTRRVPDTNIEFI